MCLFKRISLYLLILLYSLPSLALRTDLINEEDLLPELESSLPASSSSACKKISNKLASVSYTECLNLGLKPSALSEKRFPIFVLDWVNHGKEGGGTYNLGQAIDVSANIIPLDNS